MLRPLCVHDNDRSAKDVCEVINKIYTQSTAQGTNNLLYRLNNLSFDENRSNWDHHLSSFMYIVDYLGSFDEELTEKEKVAKLICSIPKSLEPLEMITAFTEMSFDSMISTVYAEIEELKSRSSWHAKAVSDDPPQKSYATSFVAQGGGT